ncbi:SDR family oxidoreductase [Ornithinimicrobium tianjinense]|uniref:3-oxoacyl-ACP reductase n=1 Tax=Ornithinimicrobium tianjinense TaxID=1195761 RepID=A0A917BEI8_9MICO|nr:SDR family oxidoreductase [Ornithinimicrobium tianjinense]GGF40343.1 3-oxoacyl-ACP reductase [Ornithinimicrobium tianjinense]
MDLGLSDRTALVLGATSGIGRAIAQALAAEGANLVLVGRDVDRVRALTESLPSTVGVAADLTDSGTPERVLSVAQETFGDVDVLVLNGGGPRPGTARELGADGVTTAVDLLVRPHVALVQAVLPAMIERGWGRIVAVGSSGVQQPLPNLAASNVGRAALAGYLKTLAGEVAGSGVTVNMVLPGRIDTDRVTQLDQAAAERTGRTVQEVRAGSEASIPAGRYGTPEEFAAVAVFLASQAAAYVTGEQIRCDGGLVRAH